MSLSTQTEPEVGTYHWKNSTRSLRRCNNKSVKKRHEKHLKGKSTTLFVETKVLNKRWYAPRVRVALTINGDITKSTATYNVPVSVSQLLMMKWLPKHTAIWLCASRALRVGVGCSGNALQAREGCKSDEDGSQSGEFREPAGVDGE